MTTQQAINHLNDLIQDRQSLRNGDTVHDTVYVNDISALKIAVAAIRRQIPKNPILKSMDGFDVDVAAELHCPSCGSPIVNVWSKAEYKPRYCHYCGQALKWG